MSSKSDKSVKLEAHGGEKGGSVWDDGVHDAVRKIYVGQGEAGVQYIKIEYDNCGQVIGTEHGKKSLLGTEEFELEYPEEYLVRVEGYYDKVFGGDDAFIQSIKFVTNKRVSPPFGLEGGKDFKLDNNGRKINGFHGRAGDVLYALGVHSESPTPVEKLESKGGKVGDVWDDGVHDTVKKIYVGQGESGIQYVKFEYDVEGQTVVKEHGKKSFIEPEEFELHYPEEYLVRVEGYFDKVFGHEGAILQSLKFVTNKGRVSPPFGLEASPESHFVLENNGNKVIGFHGRTGEMLSAIGVYTVKTATPLTPAGPAEKLEAKGGKSGSVWDDGVHDTVRKIYVGQGESGVQYIKFVYDKGGKPVEQEHGKKSFIEPEEFELQYPDEYLVRVEGYYDKVFGHDDAIIQSVKFTTNKGRVSPPFGLEASPDSHFILENNGNKIIGFHGRVGPMLSSIGVYTVTSAAPLTPAGTKLEAQGGSGGNQWDDGEFDNVSKIFVGVGADGIQFIKFEYEKNGERVSGQDHGEKIAAEEFGLDNPNEYLVSVEGTYDNAPGYSTTPVIQSITFNTSKGTSMTYGFDTGPKFSLKEDGSKIVGFHGNASKVIHGLGAYVKPISK